jgi:hypothetical protein
MRALALTLSCQIYWSETGDVVVVACDNSFYVLRYNTELVQKFLSQGLEISEQGIENSFDLEQEVSERVRTGYFVGDCFIYTNGAGRLNYYVGGEVMTLAHLDKPMVCVRARAPNRSGNLCVLPAIAVPPWLHAQGEPRVPDGQAAQCVLLRAAHQCAHLPDCHCAP